jgi:rRNA maturation endonuclease Nob1
MTTFVNARGKTISVDGDECPEGYGLKVPIMLMDSMQREIATHYGRPAQVVDAFGMPAGQKRGYCFPNTSSGELRDAAIDARDQADQAYAELVNRDQNAWRRSVNVADKEEAEEAAKLSPTDARDSAFADLEKLSANAWRGGR